MYKIDQKSKQVQQSYLKRIGFPIFHKLLHQTHTSQIIYHLLMIWQTLQYFNFSISNAITKNQSISINKYIKYVAQLSNLSILYKSGTSTIFFVITILNFIIMIGAFIIIIRIWYIIKNKLSMNIIDNFLLTTLNLLFLLFRTVYVIPSIMLMVVAFNPIAQNFYEINFTEQMLIFLKIITLLSCFILVLFLIGILFGLRQVNPFSKVPYAGPLSKLEICKIISKISFTIYGTLDPFQQYFVIFLIVSTIYYILLIKYELTSTIFYNNTSEKLNRQFSALLLWNAINSLIITQLKIHPLPFSYILLTHLLVVFLISVIGDWFEKRIFLQPFILLKQQQDVERYVISLLMYLEKYKQAQNRIKLQGFLGIHIKQCKGSCKCDQLKNIRNRQNEIKIWYQLMLELVSQSLLRFENSRRLLMLSALILQERLNNKFAALYNLTKSIQNDAPNIYRLLQYHHKELIQYEMKEDDEKYNEKKVVNINKFFEFNNLVVHFEHKIEDCVNFHIDFWKQLMQKTPDLRKLQNLGSAITNQKEQVKENFQELCALNANNAQSLLLYGNFLIEVANDQVLHLRLIQKAESIKKNILTSGKLGFDQQRVKYGQNATTAIFVISGNQHQLGLIHNVNNQVKPLFGYSRKQLLGQNLSMIMPKVFGQSHNSVLERYLSTSQERFNCKQRGAPAFTNDGYMLPCTAMTKAFPNLALGIQIVGFLSIMRQQFQEEQLKNYNYLLYRTDTEIIQGITESCFQNYGIHPSLAYGHPNNTINQLHIKSIFSQSFEKEEIEQVMRGNLGYVAKIDTTNLESDYLINVEQNDIRNYRKSTVIIKIKLQLIYNKIPLKLISFYEQAMSKQFKSNIEYTSKSQFTKDIIKQNKITDSGYVHSIQSNNNDQLKQLKDFKSFISAKSQPRSIKIIHCFVIATILILLLLSCISLYFLETRISIISLGHKTLSSSQNVLMDLIQVTYYTRKYQLQNTWLNSNNSEILQCQKTIVSLNDDLNSQQFELLDLKNQMIKKGGNPKKYIKSYIIKQNQTLIDTIDLQISKYNLITNIYSLSRIKTMYFNFTPYKPSFKNTTTFSTFWNVIYNSIFSISRSQQQSISIIYSFYLCRFRQCSKQFQIILALALITVSLFLCIILPYIFSVNKINNRVVSLFGIIPLNEIENLMIKCSNYLIKFFPQAQIIQFQIKHQKSMEMSEIIKSDIPSQCNTPNQLIIGKGFRKNQRTLIKNEEIQNSDRSSILMNSQDNSKSKTIIHYAIITSLIAIYFIVDYILINDILVVSQTSFSDVNILNSRMILLKQLKSYSLESLIDPTLSISNLLPIYNQTTNLISSVYSVEAKLSNLNIEPFSNNFKNYFNSFNIYNICDFINIFPNSQYYNIAECKNVMAGILVKGISTTMVSILETVRYNLGLTILNQSQKISNIDNFISNLETVQKYIEGAMSVLIRELDNSFNSYMFEKMQIMMGKFIGFSVIIFIFYIFVWLPYLKQLNMKIWRTKGMLNMIPMVMINNNQKLKMEFTSGKLEKAVL